MVARPRPPESQRPSERKVKEIPPIVSRKEKQKKILRKSKEKQKANYSSISSPASPSDPTGRLLHFVEWASWTPEQFAHLGVACWQRQPQIVQIAVGQVWLPVSSGTEHH